jgi:hypothetical protein
MNVLRAFFVSLILVQCSAPAEAEPTLREGFEGPETSWHDAGGDAHYKILAQQRQPSGAHSGNGCESLRVSGDSGTYVYLSHEIGAARIIGELAASVWVKADRPGLQILVRVVLPRSTDPRTGRPMTALIAGSGYTQVGAWQQLRVDNFPQLLERQVRVLRAQNGPQVDAHEAYLDRVLLNIYGGPGSTSVSIDDLEITGYVGRPSAAGNPPAGNRATLVAAASERLPSTSAALPAETSRSSGAAARLSGAGLMIGDKPFFPRMIEYRGEPLERLKALGFNAVRLATTPDAALLRDAANSGMWLVAPPPSSRELEARAALGAAGRIDSEFESVLIWDLGQGLSTRELDSTKRWSRLVRTADARARPRICDADSDLTPYSRQVDLLFAHRFPLASSLGVGAYAAWLRERPQLALPGTPLWTVIQTQPAERLSEQVAALSGRPHPNLACQDEQVRLLVFAALASGVRGICFQSQTPLTADDPATRRRAALVELINLELELIEPWCASGSFVTGAGGSDPDTSAAVMQTDRARLVLPLATAPLSQFALRSPQGGVATYVIPGVPESNDAYELTPASFRPLAHKRVAGGTRVVLPDGERGSLVVLTQDSQVVANLSRRAAKIRRRAAELQQELARMHLARIDDVQSRLAVGGHSTPDTPRLLETARASLKQSDAQLAAGDHQNCFLSARRGEQQLYHIERTCWEKSVQPGATPLAIPLGLSYDTLADYWQFSGGSSAAPRGANLLPAGEFEDLPAMLKSGWRHYQHPQPSVVTDVQLSSEPVHGGKLALRLQVAAAKPELPPTLVETAPLWVTAAAVPVEAGQVLAIHGWVNLPRAPAGSVDGLLIIDSLGGEPLAERIGQTAGWREITLYRAAIHSEMLVVTFALTGLGEAWLDDFSIQVVDRSSAAALEQAAQSGGSAPPRR